MRKLLLEPFSGYLEFADANPTGRYELMFVDSSTELRGLVDRRLMAKLLDLCAKELATRALNVNALWWRVCPCALCKQGDTSKVPPWSGLATTIYRGVDYRYPPDRNAKLDCQAPV